MMDRLATDGAYDHSSAQDRPVYGALDLRRRGTGGAPRFGSSYFRLSGAVLDRTTFCFPDSADDPEHFGVAARMGLIELAEASHRDLLDDYIEAQVHGGVRLDRDVAELVLDPGFADTEVEQAARRLPCPIGRHGGYSCMIDDLNPHVDYRGAAIIELAGADRRQRPPRPMDHRAPGTLSHEKPTTAITAGCYLAGHR